LTTTIAQQIAHVRAELDSRPEGLVHHVERVLNEARLLARHWEVDPQRVELATWGHDLFRAEQPAELLRLAREAGIRIEPADDQEPVLLHGPIAAVVLRERFEVTDDDVLAAVRDHTLGLDEMPLIAKIILIADKVETHKRRRARAMRKIRELAWRDLDTALLCWADWNWVQAQTLGFTTHPQHWHARRRWVAEHHIDIAMPGRVAENEFAAAASDFA
jgi:predicted HD superfamily hydrolase involved in NAD metabolism